MQQLAHCDAITDPAQDGQPVALSVEPVGGNPGLAAATTICCYRRRPGQHDHRHLYPGSPPTLAHRCDHHHRHHRSIVNHQPFVHQLDRDLAVFGDTGRIEASGATASSWPRGDHLNVGRGSCAPESVAIEVSASGGPVTASIQQHRLDGIVPAGVDTLQPAATVPMSSSRAL